MEGDSLLEVIFSPPIIQDVKKLQTSTNNVPETLNNKNVDKVNKINKNIVEPDLDDRGKWDFYYETWQLLINFL